VLRVIAGSLKGRRLQSGAWSGLRPTADRLRETLFNVLARRVEGARVLDAYAGTGAIGIEALSRGASFVTFVERDRRARELIERNLERCGVSNGCAIIHAHTARAFELLRQGPSRFDIIVLDPPYGESVTAIDPIVEAAGELVVEGGVLAFEHARTRQISETVGRLVRTRTVVSGDSALTFYEPGS
jgi:16S rRNA (guanine966-N2)-methyltransferase